MKEWKAFIQDVRTKAVIKLGKQKLKVLLKHIWPRKIKGQVAFGFEDPSVTGKTLASLSLMYPLCKNKVQITPYFDRSILEGNLYIRGRIYVFVILKLAWELYKDKNVKYVMYKFQSKEG